MPTTLIEPPKCLAHAGSLGHTYAVVEHRPDGEDWLCAESSSLTWCLRFVSTDARRGSLSIWHRNAHQWQPVPKEP